MLSMEDKKNFETVGSLISQLQQLDDGSVDFIKKSLGKHFDAYCCAQKSLKTTIIDLQDSNNQRELSLALHIQQNDMTLASSWEKIPIDDQTKVCSLIAQDILIGDSIKEIHNGFITVYSNALSYGSYAVKSTPLSLAMAVGGEILYRSYIDENYAKGLSEEYLKNLSEQFYSKENIEKIKELPLTEKAREYLNQKYIGILESKITESEKKGGLDKATVKVVSTEEPEHKKDVKEYFESVDKSYPIEEIKKSQHQIATEELEKKETELKEKEALLGKAHKEIKEKVEECKNSSTSFLHKYGTKFLKVAAVLTSVVHEYIQHERTRENFERLQKEAELKLRRETAIGDFKLDLIKYSHGSTWDFQTITSDIVIQFNQNYYNLPSVQKRQAEECRKEIESLKTRIDEYKNIDFSIEANMKDIKKKKKDILWKIQCIDNNVILPLIGTAFRTASAFAPGPTGQVLSVFGTIADIFAGNEERRKQKKLGKLSNRLDNLNMVTDCYHMLKEDNRQRTDALDNILFNQYILMANNPMSVKEGLERGKKELTDKRIKSQRDLDMLSGRLAGFHKFPEDKINVLIDTVIDKFSFGVSKKDIPKLREKLRKNFLEDFEKSKLTPEFQLKVLETEELIKNVKGDIEDYDKQIGIVDNQIKDYELTPHLNDWWINNQKKTELEFEGMKDEEVKKIIRARTLMATCLQSILQEKAGRVQSINTLFNGTNNIAHELHTLFTTENRLLKLIFGHDLKSIASKYSSETEILVKASPFLQKVYNLAESFHTANEYWSAMVATRKDFEGKSTAEIIKIIGPGTLFSIFANPGFATFALILGALNLFSSQTSDSQIIIETLETQRKTILLNILTDLKKNNDLSIEIKNSVEKMIGKIDEIRVYDIPQLEKGIERIEDNQTKEAITNLEIRIKKKLAKIKSKKSELLPDHTEKSLDKIIEYFGLIVTYAHQLEKEIYNGGVEQRIDLKPCWANDVNLLVGYLAKNYQFKDEKLNEIITFDSFKSIHKSIRMLLTQLNETQPKLYNEVIKNDHINKSLIEIRGVASRLQNFLKLLSDPKKNHLSKELIIIKKYYETLSNLVVSKNDNYVVFLKTAKEKLISKHRYDYRKKFIGLDSGIRWMSKKPSDKEMLNYKNNYLFISASESYYVNEAGEPISLTLDTNKFKELKDKLKGIPEGEDFNNFSLINSGVLSSILRILENDKIRIQKALTTEFQKDSVGFKKFFLTKTLVNELSKPEPNLYTTSLFDRIDGYDYMTRNVFGFDMFSRTVSTVPTDPTLFQVVFFGAAAADEFVDDYFCGGVANELEATLNPGEKEISLRFSPPYERFRAYYGLTSGAPEKVFDNKITQVLKTRRLFYYSFIANGQSISRKVLYLDNVNVPIEDLKKIKRDQYESMDIRLEDLKGDISFKKYFQEVDLYLSNPFTKYKNIEAELVLPAQEQQERIIPLFLPNALIESVKSNEAAFLYRAELLNLGAVSYRHDLYLDNQSQSYKVVLNFYITEVKKTNYHLETKEPIGLELNDQPTPCLSVEIARFDKLTVDAFQKIKTPDSSEDSFYLRNLNEFLMIAFYGSITGKDDSSNHLTLGLSGKHSSDLNKKGFIISGDVPFVGLHELFGQEPDLRFAFDHKNYDAKVAQSLEDLAKGKDIDRNEVSKFFISENILSTYPYWQFLYHKLVFAIRSQSKELIREFKDDDQIYVNASRSYVKILATVKLLTNYNLEEAKSWLRTHFGLIDPHLLLELSGIDFINARNELFEAIHFYSDAGKIVESVFSKKDLLATKEKELEKLTGTLGKLDEISQKNK